VIGHSEQGSCLHHYTSVDNAINILGSGELWLGSIENANDPKEFSNWQLNQKIGNTQLSFEKWQELSREISVACKKACKIACFSTDVLTDHESMFQRYVDVGCIGRGFAISPMWHFYGGQHTGVCLMFDRRKLVDQFFSQWEDPESAYADSIDYFDDQLPRNIGFEPYWFDPDELEELGFAPYIKLFLQQRMREIYFKKQTVWEYEREFRLSVIDQSEGPFKLKFRNTLSHLCFGARCNDSDIQRVLELLKSQNVGHDHIYFKNHSIQIKM